jgi:tRNA dimethylallyltransferase
MIIFYGPTGVGKSDIALEFAKIVPSEIINMDVGQFYVPLTIGTAKPDWRASSVLHHFFDTIDQPIDYTVIAYKKALIKLVHEVRSRGNMPLIVGGSGFYLKSLFFSPITTGIQTTSYIQQESDETLWHTLHTIDPVRAQKIQPHDIYRIRRALDIWHTTGTLPSAHKPLFHNEFGPCAIVNLIRDRGDLYDRINNRVHTMFDTGWMNEVKRLSPAWVDFIQRKKIIGYTDIVDYIKEPDDCKNYEQLAEIIAQRTRHYARRQMIFLRMLSKKLHDAKRQIGENMPLHIDINLSSTHPTIYRSQLHELYRILVQKDDYAQCTQARQSCHD